MNANANPVLTSVLQLRNHIPISAGARREPEDGTSSAMRVSLGFEPAWFHLRCGVDFSERWHRDPLYRYQTLERMQRELLRAFPEAGCWRSGSLHDLATVSGCYGSCVIPHLFGVRWSRKIGFPCRTWNNWTGSACFSIHWLTNSLNRWRRFSASGARFTVT
ncbi:MAG: hypothetical protein M1423_06695 [Acidobacteria bacterium]|nr:hypothetical protein [Acidobacteriota bacterium]